jgi:alkanesulfonate monooxygenase SsuD/methylene tetrahydromethanopterin reductase-like flavin-dependent oxidoreductase (luciferase family)
VQVAQKAEVLGHHALWLSDHIGAPITLKSMIIKQK